MGQSLCNYGNPIKMRHEDRATAFRVRIKGKPSSAPWPIFTAGLGEVAAIHMASVDQGRPVRCDYRMMIMKPVPPAERDMVIMNS